MQTSSKKFSSSSLFSLLFKKCSPFIFCLLYFVAVFERYLFCLFGGFFLTALSLVLPYCVRYSYLWRLCPCHCLFCGQVISSLFNSTAVLRLTAFRSGMCYFVLNLKLFPDLVLKLSVVFKSLYLFPFCGLFPEGKVKTWQSGRFFLRNSLFVVLRWKMNICLRLTAYEAWPGAFPALQLCWCGISKRPERIWETK